MNASVEKHKFRLSRPTLIFLGLGIFLIVAYFLLAHFHIGKFGADSDIGGGLVLAAGYLFTFVGVLMAIIEFRKGR